MLAPCDAALSAGRGGVFRVVPPHLIGRIIRGEMAQRLARPLLHVGFVSVEVQNLNDCLDAVRRCDIPLFFFLAGDLGARKTFRYARAPRASHGQRDSGKECA
jgi:hypothetical protein